MHEDDQYAKLADKGKSNEKKWWSLLKQVYNVNNAMEAIPPLQKQDEVISDDKDKANLFNEFFLKASTTDDSNSEIPANAFGTFMGPHLDTIPITYDDVKEQLEILKCNKAYGHDEISPKFLKEGGRTIIEVLQKLFELS